MKPAIPCLVTVLALSAGWTQQATAVGGDATAWGARNPGDCPSIRGNGPPTKAQAATMVRCFREGINQGSGELTLIENLRIEIGGAMPFVTARDTWVMSEADVRVRVYPLRGSYTVSICKSRHDAGLYGNPDLNCYETDVPNARGVCWKTTFGDWRCLLNGPSENRRDNRRPPQPRAR